METEAMMAENQNYVVESKMEDPKADNIDDEDDADLEVLTFSRHLEISYGVIFLLGMILFAVGSSLTGVKIVQRVVEECIVRKVSIASRIKTAIAVKSEWKTAKKLEALRF